VGRDAVVDKFAEEGLVAAAGWKYAAVGNNICSAVWVAGVDRFAVVVAVDKNTVVVAFSLRGYIVAAHIVREKGIVVHERHCSRMNKTVEDILGLDH